MDLIYQRQRRPPQRRDLSQSWRIVEPGEELAQLGELLQMLGRGIFERLLPKLAKGSPCGDVKKIIAMIRTRAFKSSCPPLQILAVAGYCGDLSCDDVDPR